MLLALEDRGQEKKKKKIEARDAEKYTKIHKTAPTQTKNYQAQNVSSSALEAGGRTSARCVWQLTAQQ